MGIGPEVLHARNPHLIIVRISGWGQDGMWAHKPCFGSLVEAMSGFAAMNGFGDRAPLLPPLALADMVAGLYGAFSVMVRSEARRVGEECVSTCRTRWSPCHKQTQYDDKINGNFRNS